MRIALLGLAHETNTFSSVTTDLAKFENDGILRGEEIVAAHATAHTSLAGFLGAGKNDPSIEIVRQGDLIPIRGLYHFHLQ